MAPKAGNGLIPQPLPPSVEEAYRRKCRYLRHRTNEIEENNEVSRARLARLKRQAEKIRLERAYLLEQIAKRTSTNVEDSDGSPSPPPTPKDKPLRLKRGHRKPSVAEDAPAPNGTAAHSSANKPNGAATAAKPVPTSAYDVYCSSMRRVLLDTNTDKPNFNIDEELQRCWKELTDELRQPYQKEYDALMKEAAATATTATTTAAEDGSKNEKADKESTVNGAVADSDKEAAATAAAGEEEDAEKKDDEEEDEDEEKPEDDADVEFKSEAKAPEADVEAEVEVEVEADEDEDIEMADGADTRPASPKDE